MALPLFEEAHELADIAIEGAVVSVERGKLGCRINPFVAATIVGIADEIAATLLR